MSLRIVFAGSSAFAVPTLKALLASSHQICAVYTVIDKPAGRGLQLTETPIKQLALQHGLQIFQPATLQTEEEQEKIARFRADIMIDVAYGLLLPKIVLDSFPLGCINVHPSLLPRWRGAAPIQRSLLVGDGETGVTIMQVDEGWDTGAILRQAKLIIANDDTSASLHDKLAVLGAKLLLETIDSMELKKIFPVPQNNAESCYAKKINKEEAIVNWQLDAASIARMVRAFISWPIAFTTIGAQTIRIWKAQELHSDIVATNTPGEIIRVSRDGVDVSTGKGVLRLLELQLAGGKVLPVSALLNAKRDLFNVGSKLGVSCSDKRLR